MQRIFYLFIAALVLAGCSKSRGSRVEIFMLKSFTTRIDTTNKLVLTYIEDPVAEDKPLVADKEILFYNQSTFTYKINKNIHSIIAGYGPDKAFVVVVDGEPVYYGKFHPGYLSSIIPGIATIDPISSLNNNELTMRYSGIQNDPLFTRLDKRNDKRIIRALNNTDRLR